MDRDERHVVFRLGCLVGQRRPLSGSQSTGILSANATYTLVCSGTGRHRDPVRHGVHQISRTHRQLERGSQRHHQRQQRDVELDGDECHLLYRLGGLVGHEGRVRHPIDRRTDGQRDLYAELHRSGRQAPPSPPR